MLAYSGDLKSDHLKSGLFDAQQQYHAALMPTGYQLRDLGFG